MNPDRAVLLLDAMSKSLVGWVAEAATLREACPKAAHLHASLAQAQQSLHQLLERGAKIR